MSGLTGLQGLSFSAQAFQVPAPELDAAGRLGGAADPAHGQPLWAAPYRYPWEAGAVWGPVNQPRDVADPGLVSQPLFASSAGQLGQDPVADLTPYRTHAAPWPKGVETSTDPDAVSRQLAQSADIHASNTGAARRITAAAGGWARQDDWEMILVERTGDTMQDPGIPLQVKSAAPGSGYGSRDRVSSLARQNAYGFDTAHMQRRYAANPPGSIPGNYLWMVPGQRPMTKSIPGPARPPIGAVGPFTGQDTTQFFGPAGAVLTSPAGAYVAPPEPPLGTAPGQAAPGPVSWW